MVGWQVAGKVSVAFRIERDQLTTEGDIRPSGRVAATIRMPYTASIDRGRSGIWQAIGDARCRLEDISGAHEAYERAAALPFLRNGLAAGLLFTGLLALLWSALSPRLAPAPVRQP